MDSHPLLRMPILVWNEILSYLPPSDFHALRLVSTEARDIVDNYPNLEKVYEETAVSLNKTNLPRFISGTCSLPYTCFEFDSISFPGMFKKGHLSAFQSKFRHQVKTLTLGVMTECKKTKQDYRFLNSLSSLKRLRISELLEDVRDHFMLQQRVPQIPVTIKNLTELHLSNTETLYYEKLIEAQIGNTKLRLLTIPTLEIDTLDDEDHIQRLRVLLAELGESRKARINHFAPLEIDFVNEPRIFQAIVIDDPEERDRVDEADIEVLRRYPLQSKEKRFVLAMLNSKISLKFVCSPFLERLTCQQCLSPAQVTEFFSCVSEISYTLSSCLLHTDTPQVKSLVNISYAANDQKWKEGTFPPWPKLNSISILQWYSMPENATLPMIIGGPVRTSVETFEMSIHLPNESVTIDAFKFNEIINVCPHLMQVELKFVTILPPADYIQILKTIAGKTQVRKLTLIIPVNTSPSIFLVPNKTPYLLTMKYLTSLSINVFSLKELGRTRSKVLNDQILVNVISKLPLTKLSMTSEGMVVTNISSKGILALSTGPLSNTVESINCKLNFLSKDSMEVNRLKDALQALRDSMKVKQAQRYTSFTASPHYS